MVPFPQDVSWIQDARALEVEAVNPGASSTQLAATPSLGIASDEEDVMMSEVDDVQDIEGRIGLAPRYVPHAREAFEDRGMTYPFEISDYKASLVVIPGFEELAANAARLSEMVTRGGATAKEFEVRATQALHRLIGGWAACVGAPRKHAAQYGGLEKAIRGFRAMLDKERGDYFPSPCAAGGDDGLDAVFILGRSWGGPVVFLQSKNSSFCIKDIPQEFARQQDICHKWFGRRIGDGRAVIPVFAVNSVLTHAMKEQIHAAGWRCHVIDAVDILLAESLPEAQPRHGEALLVM
jgi:hypothetical protein